MSKSRQHPLKDFFRLASHAIQKEDLFLNHFMREREEFKKEWHKGIADIFETTIVYTVFRELLACGYPRALGWEVSYPGWKQAKADLAIYSRDAIPEYIIEFKWQGPETLSDSVRFWNEVAKILHYCTESGATRLFLFLLSRGEVSSAFRQNLGPGNYQTWPQEHDELAKEWNDDLEEGDCWVQKRFAGLDLHTDLIRSWPHPLDDPSSDGGMTAAVVEVKAHLDVPRWRDAPRSGRRQGSEDAPQR